MNDITKSINQLPSPPLLASGLENKKANTTLDLSTLTAGHLVQEYLKILSCDDDFSFTRSNNSFLTPLGSTEGMGTKYSLGFGKLGEKMKRGLVETIIEEKFKMEGVRCWRILEEKGKLDEKHVRPSPSYIPKKQLMKGGGNSWLN